MAIIIGLVRGSVEVLQDVARDFGVCEVDVVGCDDGVGVCVCGHGFVSLRMIGIACRSVEGKFYPINKDSRYIINEELEQST